MVGEGRNIFLKNITYSDVPMMVFQLDHDSQIPNTRLLTKPSPARELCYFHLTNMTGEAPRIYPNPCCFLQELEGIASTHFNLCISVIVKEGGQYRDTHPTADSKNFMTTPGIAGTPLTWSSYHDYSFSSPHTMQSVLAKNTKRTPMMQLVCHCFTSSENQSHQQPISQPKLGSLLGSHARAAVMTGGNSSCFISQPWHLATTNSTVHLSLKTQEWITDTVSRLKFFWQFFSSLKPHLLQQNR